MAGTGSSIGGALGGLAGALYGPLGSAVGTAAGGLVGGALEAIPALATTETEKENERRLAQLRRMRELGALGLSEAEKQQLFTSGQGQAAAQLRQAQQTARAAGAAGMQTGAGAEQLRQAQSAQVQAETAANVARSVEAQNLARRRELEAEIDARTAAVSQARQEAQQAVTGALSGALVGGLEEFKLKQEQLGKAPTAGEIQAFANAKGIPTADADAFLRAFASGKFDTKMMEDLFAGRNK